jgi:hypothetical protein
MSPSYGLGSTSCLCVNRGLGGLWFCGLGLGTGKIYGSPPRKSDLLDLLYTGGPPGLPLLCWSCLSALSLLLIASILLQ